MRRQSPGGPGPTKLNIKRSCEQSIIKFFLSYTFSMKSFLEMSVVCRLCLKLANFLNAADPRHLKLAADEQQVGWAVTEGPNNHHN